MRFEFFRHIDSWYWRLRARNGKIVADGGEAYLTRGNVLRAIKRMRRDLSTVPIHEEKP
jgi:uncharacterized protein YegP (UPF0339 family)